MGLQNYSKDFFWGGEGEITFNGGKSLMEHNFQWKRTFDGRRTLMEDSLCWRKAFNISDYPKKYTSFWGFRGTMGVWKAAKMTFLDSQ